MSRTEERVAPRSLRRVRVARIDGSSEGDKRDVGKRSYTSNEDELQGRELNKGKHTAGTPILIPFNGWPFD